MRPTLGCDKVGNPRTFELKPRKKLPAGYADAPPLGKHPNDPTRTTASERSGGDKKAAPAARVATKVEEGKMIEDAWIIAVAVVTFATIVGVVLLVSGKLYDPDRSHQ